MKHRSIMVSALITLLIVAVHSGYKAGWIAAKAGIAQYLLAQAWQQSLSLQQPVKPWPWMDSYPVARLTVTRSGETHIVLEGASGEAMAFGPSRMHLPVKPSSVNKVAGEMVAISGHRDTHLRFLQHMQPGDTVSLQTVQGHVRKYVMESKRVIDTDTEDLLIEPSAGGLLLVTCFPFDTFSFGGPLRLVAYARLIT